MEDKIMDRITNLPDAIRIQIVSCLPTKEALRTSLLSTPWRHISSSLPKLEFKQRLFRCLKSESYRRYRRNFRNSVYKTLSSHDDETVLESLDLALFLDDEDVTSRDIGNWVTSALKHRLQRLFLRTDCIKPLNLPSELFECDTLKYLHFGIFNLRIPSRIRFPNLRTLVLFGVKFPDHYGDDNLVNKIFQLSTFPMLESLKIIYCRQIHILCISLPSLQYLVLHSDRSHRRVHVSIPSLRNIAYVGCPIDICPKTLASLNTGFFEFPPNQNPNTDASDILFGLRNVETLRLKAPFIDSLSHDELFFRKLPILSVTLKHLHLEIYRTKRQTQAISFLIKCFPQLQTLHIYSRDIPEDVAKENTSELYFEDESKFPNLARIQFKFFGGSEAELELVRNFLQHASGSMELNISYKVDMEELQMTIIIGKLLALPRGPHHVVLNC